MSCSEWKEHLVGRIYQEIDAHEDARLAAHLPGCAACTAELEELERTRRTLRESLPEVPLAPRVVLLAPRASRLPLLAVAASLAGIGLLSGLAVSWSWQARGAALSLARSASGSPVQQTALPASGPSEEDVQRWVDARIDKLLEERTTHQASGSAPARSSPYPVTKPEVDAMLTRMERKLDRGRSDLRYRSASGGRRARTGFQLGETQRAISIWRSRTIEDQRAVGPGGWCSRAAGRRRARRPEERLEAAARRNARPRPRHLPAPSGPFPVVGDGAGPDARSILPRDARPGSEASSCAPLARAARVRAGGGRLSEPRVARSTAPTRAPTNRLATPAPPGAPASRSRADDPSLSLPRRIRPETARRRRGADAATRPRPRRPPRPRSARSVPGRIPARAAAPVRPDDPESADLAVRQADPIVVVVKDGRSAPPPPVSRSTTPRSGL